MLILFLIIMIISSMLIGFYFDKKLNICKYLVISEKTNLKNKKPYAYYFLFAYFILTYLHAGMIPVIRVLRGTSYHLLEYEGIPYITVIMTAIAMYESFRLTYRYFFCKDKRALFYNIIIMVYFLSLVQRQNVLVCLAIFLNGLYLSKFRGKIKWNYKKVIFLIIAILLLLYGFGVFGNMRYSSMWAWNNSSMILKLGKANSKMPSFIPGEYFWSYIYTASPLSNLNVNIQTMNPNGNIGQFIYEFIPQFLANKIGLSRASVYLPVSALTVCTSYARVHNTLGYFGMYIMLMVEYLICFFVTFLTIKYNKENVIPQLFGVTYVLLLSIFTNPISYSISGVLIIILFVNSFKYRIRHKKGKRGMV